MRTRPRPIFFLFMILGATVVLPYLITMPIQTTFRAAWMKKRRRLAWRIGVLTSLFLTLLISQPASPIFVGFGTPIPFLPESQEASFFVTPQTLINAHLMVINAAIIALFVCFPLSTLSTLDTMHTRRKNIANGESEVK